MTAETTRRWRRGLAAAAALTLPLTVAACGEDEADDPGIIEEEVTPEETPEPDMEDEGGEGTLEDDGLQGDLGEGDDE